MVYKNCLKFAHKVIIKLDDMLSCERKEWEKRKEVFKKQPCLERGREKIGEEIRVARITDVDKIGGEV